MHVVVALPFQMSPTRDSKLLQQDVNQPKAAKGDIPQSRVIDGLLM